MVTYYFPNSDMPWTQPRSMCFGWKIMQSRQVSFSQGEWLLIILYAFYAFHWSYYLKRQKQIVLVALKATS